MKIRRRSFLMVAAVAVLVLGAVFYLSYIKPQRVVPILMYHAVGDVKGNTLYVSPENFKKQMTFLHDRGYTVISLDKLVDAIASGVKFMPKTVVVTFDDGLKDNYINAFPVLVKYNMPATIFLITGSVDKRENYLNWDQVELMAKNNIDFGGHTRNNVYLPEVTDDNKLRAEIDGSKKDIEENTGREVKYFCYPTGGFNENIKRIVAESGYKGACTTNRGLVRGNTDVYELKRVKVTNSDMEKPFHFKAKISGYYNLFRKIRPGS
ncbi:MAG: polysaccharide deacetylase family protein [Candidatus Omnitrophica bacterium]|nr:polysaccharide deacetylase family protein [Candidatus Omnitrophota bacterium]